MANDIDFFLQKAGLCRPKIVPNLPCPDTFAVDPLPEDEHEARRLLAERRIIEPGYRKPEDKKRNFYRSKTSAYFEKKDDLVLRIFKPHIVAKTLNDVLVAPLPSPGLTQAILSHAPDKSLDDLWSCISVDTILSQKRESRKCYIPFIRRGNVVPRASLSQTPWLDHVTIQNDLQHVSLLCQLRPNQETLDNALGVALTKKSLDLMRMLLRYGANASSHAALIRKSFLAAGSESNTRMVELLLSVSPQQMSSEAWRECLEPKEGSDVLPASGILLTCLANRRYLFRTSALLRKALELRNIQTAACLLAYHRGDEDEDKTSKAELCARAWHWAVRIKDDSRRCDMFEMLAKAGLSSGADDSEALREELFKDVRLRHFELVKTLVEMGVRVDVPPNDSLQWVLGKTDVEVLSTFQAQSFSGPKPDVLQYVPESATEDELVQILKILAPNVYLSGRAIDELLVRAVMKEQVHLVRILVSTGACINFNEASALRRAVENRSLNIVDILLERECSGMVLSAALGQAIALQSRIDRLHIFQSLSRKTIPQPSLKLALRALAKEEEVDYDLVGQLLQLCTFTDEDDENESCIVTAARRANFRLLKMLCKTVPNLKTITSALRAAFDANNANIGLQMMDFLLKSAESEEVGQSDLLAKATSMAVAGDWGPLTLFISHIADVDANNGDAIQVAAHGGDLEVLEFLLMNDPVTTSLYRAALAATFSEAEQSTTEAILRRLLECNKHALLKFSASDLLTDSIMNNPTHTLLPSLLLRLSDQHCSIPLKALQVSLQSSPLPLFESLIHHVSSSEILTSLFRQTHSSDFPPEKSLRVYSSILSRGPLPPPELSPPLLTALRNPSTEAIPGAEGSGVDLSLPHLLLSHGAPVNSSTASDLFSAAAEHGASREAALRLLAENVSDDSSAAIAFAHVRKGLRFEDRVESYRALLRKWKVGAEMAHEGLKDVLEKLGQMEGEEEEDLLRLLLEAGADPNEDGAECFAMAIGKGMRGAFRILSGGADLNVVLALLMGMFEEEGMVVEWLRICVEGLKEKKGERFGEVGGGERLVVQCLEKFPAGELLLGAILDLGISTSAGKVRCKLNPAWVEECCTPLIWALLAPCRIGNEFVMELIHRARDTESLGYSTPSTGVSAAFACLLDQSRTPILEALLDMDNDLLWSTIPGASLETLALHPVPVAQDLMLFESEHELGLSAASLFLGNARVYRDLVHEDGDLHVAAQLALPDIVEMLLEEEVLDPNLKLESHDMMIPLALACQARYAPMCKFAITEKGGFEARQRRTISLLGPVTDLTWRYRNKTVLHVALENGIATTEAMMTALDVAGDTARDERYFYSDRAEGGFSPVDWVRNYHHGSEVEKNELIACLSKVSWKSSRSQTKCSSL